jgi:hypothetical protein
VSLFLSKEELVMLTGKRRPKAQGRALTHMGIPYRTRLDGSPVVLRTSLQGEGGRVEAVTGESNWVARLAGACGPLLQP